MKTNIEKYIRAGEAGNNSEATDSEESDNE
jgi:hypothetical protein